MADSLHIPLAGAEVEGTVLITVPPVTPQRTGDHTEPRKRSGPASNGCVASAGHICLQAPICKGWGLL